MGSGLEETGLQSGYLCKSPSERGLGIRGAIPGLLTGQDQMRKKAGLENPPNLEEQGTLALVVGCVCFLGWTLSSLGAQSRD